MIQSFDGLEDLADLVCLGHSFSVLDINPWITFPRHPINPMTRTGLMRLSKKMVANAAQIGKPNPLRTALHLIDNSINAEHY